MQFLGIAAAVATLGILPAAVPNEGIYRALSDIASRTCQAPQNAGWNWNAAGGARASIDVSKFKQVLGTAGVTLGANSGYARWSGPLQRDVGAALASRNDCAAKVFVAMIQDLPLSEQQTGKRLPRAVEPRKLYEAVRVPLAPVNTNVSGGQQLIAAPSSTNLQVAGPSATGGPAIQNNYFPVTADQRQQAHDALIADLQELARYPERGTIEPGPSIAQHHFKFKVARALYMALAKYNFPTVASVSGGDKLNAYEADYYAFESSAPHFEQAAIMKIGTLVSQSQTYVWRAVFEYCLNRSLGFSPELIFPRKSGRG